MDVPAAIRTLATRVRDAGGRAFLVGGCVRDDRMHLPVKDLDLEVFGLHADELLGLLRALGSVNTVGRSFGVFKWRPRGPSTDVEAREIDVSVPRRDSKVGPGHKGIHVEGDPTMTPTEAARRRDLTVNAMMWDIVDGVLVDPWHGVDDLERGVLRAVAPDTFLEDPLRALRVVQFAARLGFDADPSLVELCRTAALHELPAERIQGEWHKLLLKGREPSRGMRIAREARILARVFPEVAELDADEVLDRLAAGPRGTLEPEGRAFALMLAGWLHAAAEPAVVATLDRLWLHTWLGYPIRERVLSTIAAQSAAIGTDADLRRLSTRAELPLVLAVRGARGEPVDQASARARALGVWDAAPEPLLKGRDLKGLVPPGPRMGVVLRAVYELQLEGRVATADEALAAAEGMLAGGPRPADG